MSLEGKDRCQQDRQDRNSLLDAKSLDDLQPVEAVLNPVEPIEFVFAGVSDLSDGTPGWRRVHGCSIKGASVFLRATWPIFNMLFYVGRFRNVSMILMSLSDVPTVSRAEVRVSRCLLELSVARGASF